ncbi:hypothetical protein QQ045_033135 [Rhodiola kirilowii]
MMGFRDDILNKGFELLGDEARAALEDKWKNIVTAELELSYKRLELSRELVKLSLDAPWMMWVVSLYFGLGLVVENHCFLNRL